MYNALCCSIFTPDLDVSGGVPGAKSGTAQAVPVVSPPTPLIQQNKNGEVDQKHTDKNDASDETAIVLVFYTIK